MAWSDPRQRGSFKFLCTCRSVISSFANGVKGLYSIQCQDLIGLDLLAVMCTFCSV